MNNELEMVWKEVARTWRNKKVARTWRNKKDISTYENKNFISNFIYYFNDIEKTVLLFFLHFLCSDSCEET